MFYQAPVAYLHPSHLSEKDIFLIRNSIRDNYDLVDPDYCFAFHKIFDNLLIDILGFDLGDSFDRLLYDLSEAGFSMSFIKIVYAAVKYDIDFLFFHSNAPVNPNFWADSDRNSPYLFVSVF